MPSIPTSVLVLPSSLFERRAELQASIKEREQRIREAAKEVAASKSLEVQTTLSDREVREEEIRQKKEQMQRKKQWEMTAWRQKESREQASLNRLIEAERKLFVKHAPPRGPERERSLSRRDRRQSVPPSPRTPRFAKTRTV